MTDSAIASRAAGALGLSARVFAAPVPASTMRAAAGKHPRAAYLGTDGQGWHCVRVDETLRGVARIYAVAHECVHAAQAEALGGAAAFDVAYRAESECARLHGADAAEAYRRNRFERDAQQRGAEIAAEIAADLEGTE